MDHLEKATAFLDRCGGCAFNILGKCGFVEKKTKFEQDVAMLRAWIGGPSEDPSSRQYCAKIILKSHKNFLETGKRSFLQPDKDYLLERVSWYSTAEELHRPCEAYQKA